MAISSKNEHFKEQIFLLRFLYAKVIELIGAFTSTGIILRDKNLNKYYILLVDATDKILEKKDFEGLKNDKPELYESLIGDLEDIAESWEFLREKIYEFLGKIEKKYVLTGSPVYELHKNYKILFKNTDEAIAEYKEQASKSRMKFENNIKKIKEEFEDVIGKENNQTNNLNNKAGFKGDILYFMGKEINFANKENQRNLLRTIFKDREKEWFYDEIQGEWDENWDGIKENNSNSKKYWMKFYTAGDKINTAVAIETGIKDFILKNTGTGGWIKINPQYNQ